MKNKEILLSFLANYKVYEDRKDLFEDLDKFLKNKLSSLGLVVFSSDKRGRSEFVRNFHNKKLIHKMKLENVPRHILKSYSEEEEWGVIEYSGDQVYHFLMGVVGNQIFHGFFTLANSSIEHELVLPCLSEFSKNVFVGLERIKEMNHLASLAFVDDVTDLYNQRKLYNDLNERIELYEKRKEPFSILFVDIDHFKHVNDGHGHVVGSEILRELSKVFKRALRDSDTAFRYGGDEFVLLITDSDTEIALKVAERVLNGIKNLIFKVKVDGKRQEEIKISASIGVASYPEHAKNVTEIIEMADQMMYMAKESGRGQICCMKKK